MIYLKGFCSMGLLLLLFSKTSQDCSIRVIIYGYEHYEGVLHVALFNTAEHFLEKPYRAMTVNTDLDSTVAIFDPLPEDKYAIAVFLDTNGNHKLDKHFLGWPKELYGFSNHTQESTGPPDFDEAAFEVYETNHTIRIQLH